MPLFKNNEELDLRKLRNYDGDGQIENSIKDAIKKFNNIGFPIKLTFREGIVTYNDSAGMKEGKRMIYMPFITTVNTDDGTVTMRYADSFVKTGAGETKYSPNGRAFRRTKVFQSNQIEELLFIYLFSPHVRNGTIVIDDPKSVNQEKALKRQREAKISYMIYDETSPLNSTPVKLRNIARAWGVSNVDRLSDAQIQNALYDRINIGEQNNDKNYGFDAFQREVREVTMSQRTQMMSVIQKAIDKDILVFKGKPDFAWFIKTSEDDVMILSVSVTELDRKKDLLADFLIGNDKYAGLLDKILGQKEKKKETKEDEEEATDHDKGSPDEEDAGSGVTFEEVDLDAEDRKEAEEKKEAEKKETAEKKTPVKKTPPRKKPPAKKKSS